ncbi:MAG: hypothetical protein RQ745_10445 [Longimicrobiales bacterium]|nr:hypothetical protein [Longimicrobiales bacterium]
MSLRLARGWAVVGVVALLLRSAISLAGTGWSTTVARGLSPWEWVGLCAVVGLFVWGEGVRALARVWVPFVMGRVRALGAPGTSPRSELRYALAPLWVVGLVASERRILARAWTAVTAIVIAILLVRRTPDPWRGMIQLGVSGALLVGAATLAVCYLREFSLAPSPRRAGCRLKG